ncbi:MAG: AbrB/MazE/SpoVT family DNA-binding domain-containing protein [Nitrososphaerota archaeon]
MDGSFKEVRILKILKKPGERGFLITIPKEAAEKLGLKEGEKVKALADEGNRRLVYEVLPY